MKQVQLVLYNQIHTRYCVQNDDISFLYIHHTGEISFNGNLLRLNTYSKVLDYAMGKNFVTELLSEGKKAEFYIAKEYVQGIGEYCKKHGIQKVLLVEPTEYFVFQNFLKVQKKLEKEGIILEFSADTESFMLTREEFQKQFKKPPIMEFFYRFMRKKFNILMDGKNPLGGEWNYDKENRKFEKHHTKGEIFSLTKNEGMKEACEYYRYTPEFLYPIKRSEALALLDFFIQQHLENFGKLEDAMYQTDAFVHHSLLSTAINFGLLTPQEVIQRVEETDTSLNNKEGFIRQILGWREYMYQYFWFYKESIYQENFFGYTQSLPRYFWDISTGKSGMNCVDGVLQKVQTYHYSHHIERLMIIGNFALLAGYNPHEVNKWFFEMYTDAFEWVVTPNVLAMSQYADGGKLATKPYVASANYINLMSDYCKNCQYNPKEKYTDDACPMNYLYWSFVDENKAVFEKGRQQFVVKNLEKIDIEKVKELKKRFLEKK